MMMGGGEKSRSLGGRGRRESSVSGRRRDFCWVRGSRCARGSTTADADNRERLSYVECMCRCEREWAAAVARGSISNKAVPLLAHRGFAPRRAADASGTRSCPRCAIRLALARTHTLKRHSNISISISSTHAHPKQKSKSNQALSREARAPNSRFRKARQSARARAQASSTPCRAAGPATTGTSPSSAPRAVSSKSVRRCFAVARRERERTALLVKGDRSSARDARARSPVLPMRRATHSAPLGLLRALIAKGLRARKGPFAATKRKRVCCQPLSSAPPPPPSPLTPPPTLSQKQQSTPSKPSAKSAPPPSPSAPATPSYSSPNAKRPTL